MSRSPVNIEEVRLYTRGIHRFSSTSGYNEVLLINQALFNSLIDVSAAMVIRIRLIDRTCNKVIPAENLFCPNLERIKKQKVRSICQGQFVLTISNEPLDRILVVIHAGVCNQVINTVHLHGDLSTDRDLATNDCIPKLPVILRDRSV